MRSLARGGWKLVILLGLFVAMMIMQCAIGVGMGVERYELAVVGLGLIGAGALRAASASGCRAIGIGSPEPAVFADHDGPFASHYDSGRVTRHGVPTAPPDW